LDNEKHYGKREMKSKHNNRRDYYYWRAKKEGYRSRAAYKLIQIIEKFKVIGRGDVVVDLGAAPGGWIQVAREKVGEEGYVLGVDIETIKRFPWRNVKTIRADVTRENIEKIIVENLPKREADVVISDLSPKVTGVWELDHARQIHLTQKALEISLKILKSNGRLILKVFQGSMINDVLKRVKENFRYVRLFKPQASRKKSAEIYIIAKGRIGQRHRELSEER